MSDLMAEGRYLASLKQASMTQSEGGTPQMEIVFQIEDIVRKVFLYFSEKAAPYSLPKLQSLGFNGDFENPTFTKTTEIELICKHELYGGKNEKYKGCMMEKWDLAPRGKPAAPDSLKRLGAEFRAITGAAPPKPAGRPASPPARGGPPKREPAPVSNPVSITDDGSWDADKAWTHWEKHWDKKDADGRPRAEDWGNALEKVEKATKRAEANFTSSDWFQVAALGEVPW